MTDSFGRMISRRFALWQKAVALAPLLLLLVYLPGETLLRCRSDGLLRPACCCPEARQQESNRQDSGPVLKAQDCCDREVTQNQRLTAESARPADRDVVAEAPVVLVVALAPLVTPPTHYSEWASHRHGPAREGPPIVLLKHAFLI
jgi:hypothetical protein